MTKLYSYVVKHDYGAAPNPFWNVCSLVICKPRIRRSARQGDWIVGTGSASSPLGDISDHLIYAMKVTRKMPMRDYDTYCREHLPGKIPEWRSRDPRRRVGDAIYDYSVDPPNLRQGVHTEGNRERDLGGRYALLSEHFFYFGAQPVPLPPQLLGLIVGRGHQSDANEPYLAPFLTWLDGLNLRPNRLYGRPQGPFFKHWDPDPATSEAAPQSTPPGLRCGRGSACDAGALHDK
jgi:hypothetical protein